MKLSAAAIALCCALAGGCRPETLGRCSVNSDCRAGASCAVDRGICVAASGGCTPACGQGEVCASLTCEIVSPTVSVVLDASTVLSPAAPRVKVRVDASPVFALGALTVEVDSDHAVASGALAQATAGDNFVALGHFDGQAAGPVSVFATLTFTPRAGGPVVTRSVAVPARLDAQPPAISTFVPAASDSVNGWVPRTSGTLEVRAQVDDGAAGTGAASATLTLDQCPANAPCSYPGALLSRSGTAATFSFAVPRAVQQAGSEARVAATIAARDQAANEGRAPVALLIDDAGPRLGPVSLVSRGTLGEDGKTWFAGGTGAPDVEIAVHVFDGGAGVGQVALTLPAAEVAPGTPLQPAPFVPGSPDGAVHFRLPASAVQGREGALHFSVDARDAVGNAASLPATDATALWIDDLPPTVTTVQVDYASAAPAGVCASPAASGCAAASPGAACFVCGRDGAHLLRDDTATVSFDAWDCGAGLSASATVSAAGGVPGAAQGGAASGTPCAGSKNAAHHFTYLLRLAVDAPALPPPDASGVVSLDLSAAALDLLAHAGSSSAGTVQVSLVRWRTQVNGALLATGSPALAPGPSPRLVVFGTQTQTTAGSSSNLFALNADGSLAWKSALSPAVSGDVAIDGSGLVYAASGDYACSGNAHCGALNLAPAATGVPLPACSVATGEGFGAPPVLTPVPGANLTTCTTAGGCYTAVIPATARIRTNNDNVFVYEAVSGKCTSQSSSLLTLAAGQGELTGATADGDDVFFSHAAGFGSVVQTSPSSFSKSVVPFDSGTLAAFVAAAAPPAIFSGPSVEALFGGSDRRLWTTQQASDTRCANAILPCWAQLAGNAQKADAASLSSTPVFDAAGVYLADDQGTFSAFSQTTGAEIGAPLPAASPTRVSAPVLVQGSSALLVQASDGAVRLVNAAAGTDVTLLQVGPFPAGAVPPAPAVDARGAGSVVYVPDGNGFVWALQLDKPPVAATRTVWPRPGHDSCNSRNAQSGCP